jgi:hypothetical protein
MKYIICLLGVAALVATSGCQVEGYAGGYGPGYYHSSGSGPGYYGHGYHHTYPAYHGYRNDYYGRDLYHRW